MLLASLSQYKKGALHQLTTKILSKGYLVALLEQDIFCQWIRLSFGTPTESYFRNLFEDVRSIEDVERFNIACQKIQAKILEITVKSMQQRNNDKVSFEYDLQEIHRSEVFAELCWNYLPGRLVESHSGCVMIFISLGRMHLSWLTDAMTEARRQRNPELFCKKGTLA